MRNARSTVRIGRLAAAALLGAALSLVAAVLPAQAAGPRPFFQLPFACGQQWLAQTYSGHSPNTNSLDLTKVGGGSSGQAILAAFGGRVVKSGYDDGGGWHVRIDHGNGWQTRYLHMIEAPAVAVNQWVAIGQQLGRVGSTGDSGAPHLHFEQMQDGATVRSHFNGAAVTVEVGQGQTLTSHNCGGGQGRVPTGTLGDLNNSGKDDMLAQVAGGDLYVYPNTGPAGTTQWGQPYLVCGGCGDINDINVGDMNTDGKDDLVARFGDGNVYVYPNVGAPGSTTWGARYLVCGGCAHFDAINVADMNTDGKVDLMVRDAGNVYVYPNVGAPGSTTWGARYLVCGGCGHFTAVNAGDLNGDSKVDLMVREAGNLYVHPNTGAPGSTVWGSRYLVCSGCGEWRDIN